MRGRCRGRRLRFGLAERRGFERKFGGSRQNCGMKEDVLSKFEALSANCTEDL